MTLDADPADRPETSTPRAHEEPVGPTPATENASLESLNVREADTEAPPRAVVRRGGTFESFRYRDYTWFWSGALVSNTGTWMQNYALAIVVYAFRKSEFDLGLVNFISGIPVLVLALFAGAIADKVDKRKLLIWSQAVLLVQATALGVLYATGHLSSKNAIASLIWVSALGLLGGVMSALTFPSWQAMLPELVPRESLLNGIALNSAQFQTSRLLGPLAASGLVLAGAGMGEIFYVNAASFLFVIAALAAIRLRPTDDGRAHQHAQDQGDGILANLTAGLRYARENGAVGVLIVSTAMMTIFGMPYMMLLPAIADKSLGAGKLGVSYLMSANGLGAVIGALVVASLPRTAKRHLIIPFSLLAMGSMLVLFGLSHSLVFSLVISALAGAAVLTTNSLVNTSIQAAVPNHLRGRVMALFVMAFMGLMPISSIIFGALGQSIGPSNAVVVGAVILLVWAFTLIVRPGLLRPRDGHAPTL